MRQGQSIAGPRSTMLIKIALVSNAIALVLAQLLTSYRFRLQKEIFLQDRTKTELESKTSRFFVPKDLCK